MRNWLHRVDRKRSESKQFEELALLSQWEMRDTEITGVGAAIYLNLANSSELWRLNSEFVSADREKLEMAFASIS